jgi:hypothetical protein
MQTFEDALKEGFELDEGGSWMFKWEDGDNKYELWFERLLFNGQYYVALYKNMDLMTSKVVVKAGYQRGLKPQPESYPGVKPMVRKKKVIIVAEVEDDYV